MKVTYVILHYIAIKDTIECVNSILNNIVTTKENELNVVVVDNGSPNDSYLELERTFDKCDKVQLIMNKDNVGFARGNNVGFEYAKYKLNSDFIVLLNNDTIIEQSDFNELIISKYNDTKYAVLGPDIVTSDGYHQNPLNKNKWTITELRLFRIKRYIKILLTYLPDLFLEKARENSNEEYLKNVLIGDIEDTALHGACLIFSPIYLKQFDGLNSGTFLYMEEDLLKLASDFYKFKMVYSSDLRIFHKEDVATNMLQDCEKLKLRRKYKHLLDSSLVYIKLKKSMLRRVIINRFISGVGSKIKGSKYHIDLNIPVSYLMLLGFTRGKMLLRGKFKTIRFSEKGKTVFVGKKTKIKCKSKIKCGTSVTIGDNVHIDALSQTGVLLKNGSSIGPNTIIRCSGNLKEIGVGFQLGVSSSLADNCFVGATGGVYIGDNVIGGQNVRFHSSNHKYNDVKQLIRDQGVTAKGIIIGNNCWIGAGVVFCDGITIGDGCVIGANAVVTKSFPANSIIAGVPAKVISNR